MNHVQQRVTYMESWKTVWFRKIKFIYASSRYIIIKFISNCEMVTSLHIVQKDKINGPFLKQDVT